MPSPIDEIAEILALGIQRLQARAASQNPHDIASKLSAGSGDSSLHISLEQSAYRPALEGRNADVG